MNLSFENEVALLTGAASGMGLTTARAFAEAGAAVALADIDEAAVRSAAEELGAAGHKAIAIRCNVADEAEVEAMVKDRRSLRPSGCRIQQHRRAVSCGGNRRRQRRRI
jgi:NAD(P)-dependent dehydrogenase (short-subunit alcohol dehydrogenase family)